MCQMPPPQPRRPSKRHDEDEAAPPSARLQELPAKEDVPFLDRLRELRAEVQDLQALLESVRKGELTLATYADYVRTTMEDIAKLMAGIKDGDDIRHLHNIWEQISVCPLLKSPSEELPAQQQLHYLDALDAQFRRLVFIVGVSSIPARLNRWLANARPGYYVPFHAVFEDEMPLLEDRLRLLNYLAWSPKLIRGGLVDAPNGLIYRYSQSTKARLASLLLLLVAVAASVGIILGSCYLPLKGWPIAPQNAGAFLVGWAAVGVGVVVHVGVGAMKRARSERGRPPIIALGDLTLWINAKIGEILWKLLLTLIGFFGLALTTGPNNVTPLNTFLVGYSLDSVVELFGATFEQRAGVLATNLKEQLGVSVDK